MGIITFFDEISFEARQNTESYSRSFHFIFDQRAVDSSFALIKSLSGLFFHVIDDCILPAEVALFLWA